MAKVHFVADSLNCLIAGTLDRTDLTLGAFTRYAESDVDLLPLGNVFRSEVIALARDLELPGELADARADRRRTSVSATRTWSDIRPMVRTAWRRPSR